MENAIRKHCTGDPRGWRFFSIASRQALEMVFGKMKSSIAQNTSAKLLLLISRYMIFAKIKETRWYRVSRRLSCDNTAAGCSTGLFRRYVPPVRLSSETDITISVNPIPEMVQGIPLRLRNGASIF